MTDLERFFQHLVRTVSAADPALLWQTIPFAEIAGSIMPYRHHRRALQLDSSEDYEIVLMRLGAGEGGYVFLSPDDARRRLERELGSPNPDLGVLRELADAVVSLEPGRIAEALTALAVDDETTAERIAEPVAPPPPDEPTLPAPSTEASLELLDALLPALESEPTPPPAPAAAAVPVPVPVPDPETAGISSATVGATPASAAATVHCLACGEALPDDRRIKFCPYCGKGLTAQCTACGMTLDPAWQFCAGCGHPAAGRPVSRRRS